MTGQACTLITLWRAPNAPAPSEEVWVDVCHSLWSHCFQTSEMLPHSPERGITAMASGAMERLVPQEHRALIDIDELSMRLKIAKGTLYNWVYLRRIPFVKLGRALRFDPLEIERVLQSSSTLEEVGRR